MDWAWLWLFTVLFDQKLRTSHFSTSPGGQLSKRAAVLGPKVAAFCSQELRVSGGLP